MAFFLGLDAGGTNTTYVLADETQELAKGAQRYVLAAWHS
jgi:N-acetylglucosamine kinase-like BadF-type ATPase